MLSLEDDKIVILASSDCQSGYASLASVHPNFNTQHYEIFNTMRSLYEAFYR